MSLLKVDEEATWMMVQIRERSEARQVNVIMSGEGLDELIAEGRSSVGRTSTWLSPASEILNVPGVAYVGPIPADLQFISMFSGAIVTGSKEGEAAKRLIAFLASDRMAAAIKKAGMEVPRSAGR